MGDKGNDRNVGYVSAFAAYFAWGLLPAFWKLVHVVPADEILAYRIVSSTVTAGLFLLILKKKLSIREIFANRKNFAHLTALSFFLGANWFVYISAVNSGHVLDASMGYFITPLVSVALGVIFLHERLNGLQKAALFFALLGVGYKVVDFGQVPWIALILAFTFGFYGLLKKTCKLESMQSQFGETLLLSPLALVYLIYRWLGGAHYSLTESAQVDVLLAATGVVTVVPLYWFAQGAKKIPLYAIGFFQYIAPTLMLLLGVFVYGEEFTLRDAVSFGMIWLGLGCYSITLVKKMRSKLS